MKKTMKKRVLSFILAGTMVLGMGTTALAGPTNPEAPAFDKEIDGQGYIGEKDEDTEDMIDISIPAKGFFWYANEDTKMTDNTDPLNPVDYYEIRSAEYEIINNSEKIAVEVSFLSYEINPDVTLEDQIGALRNDPTDPIDISVQLKGALDLSGVLGSDYNLLDEIDGLVGTDAFLDVKDDSDDTYTDNIITYYFEGIYDDDTLPEESATSDYILKLNFEAIHSNDNGSEFEPQS